MDYQAKAEELALNAYGFWNKLGAQVANHPKTAIPCIFLFGVVVGIVL